MPVVPRVVSPEQRTAPLPRIRVSNTSPGTAQLQQLGNTLERAGDALSVRAIELQERQNADVVMAAEAALKGEYLTFEREAKARQGQNAWGLTQEATSWWEKKTAEHGKRLQNDRQRDVFNKSIQGVRLSSLQSLSSHEAAQQRVSLEQSAKASILTSINLAAANAESPGVIAGAKRDMQQRIEVLSRLNGWSPEVKAAEEATQLTNLHMQVLQNLVESRPSAAKAYYAANKVEIAGGSREALERLVQQGTVRELSQAVADDVMGRGLSESEALKEVRAKHSGEDEDTIVQAVKVRYAEREQQRERWQRQAGDRAWQIYAQTGDLSKVPLGLLNAMDGRTRAAMERDHKARVAGEGIDTDVNTYYALRTMAGADTRQFLSLDLRQYFDKLDEGDRKALIDLQARLAKDPNEGLEVATLNQQIQVAEDQLKLGGAGKSEDRAKFNRAVIERIGVRQKAEGRKLSEEERQQVIDSLIIEGSLRGDLWGTVRAYEVEGTPDAARFEADIPAEDRKQILERAGRPLTEEQLIRVWQAWRNGR